ncbi:SPFH domain-containing protein [Streptomyces sp. NPDC051976]|uniref:SPFH domain-containing protein n=1 Tax=Streptomyces sp. NPDC051976 TaxID=3154947 RepID=UPI0034138A85
MTRPLSASPATDAGLPEQAGPAGPGPAEHGAVEASLAGAPAERPGPCLPGWTAVLTALVAGAAMGWLLWRAGALPTRVAGHGLLPLPRARADRRALWSGALVAASVAAFAVGGITRGRPGSVWLLTRHGAYRGTVRTTGLLWISPLLTRRRIDVSLRHWRSRPIDAVDAHGTPLQVSVFLVWRVRDTAKASFGVDDHHLFLREEVEAAVARTVSRHPADDFRGAAPTLRDNERLAEYLTRLVANDLRAIGVEVFSVSPVRIDYAPEVAAAMSRTRIAALEARHRRAVLDDVLATVAETVRGLSERGLAQLDDYERTSLVRDLTVALCTAAPSKP